MIDIKSILHYFIHKIIPYLSLDFWFSKYWPQTNYNNILFDKCFFDSRIQRMSPETIKFLHHIIRSRSIDVMYTDTEVEYTIEMEDGTVFGFSCVYTTDEHNRPGRYYIITMNNQTLIDGFCIENKRPTETTHKIMELLRHCSNKILVQEMKSRQNGLLMQLEKNKPYN